LKLPFNWNFNISTVEGIAQERVTAMEYKNISF